MELKICHLYSDVLTLSGERGNVMCLKNRLLWRDVAVSVAQHKLGETLKPEDYDLFFLGGGEDFDHAAVAADLAAGNGTLLRAAVNDGKTFLAVCGGLQVLGNGCATADGKNYDFAGAVDLHTVGKKERIIGNVMFSCPELGGEKIIGFENHAGRTYLGAGVKPLGSLICGGGNNADDGMEGARYNNVFASYAHGSLLPKNPKLADHILKTALTHKYGTCELAPLDDALEFAAHDYMAARLQK